ncbi:MAG: adenosylmethionine decarboxylase, partial [Desulfovibrionaceae bacterium]
MKEAIGEHYILELFDCPFKTLDDESLVAGAVRQACRAGGLTLLGLQSHKFEPQGVTTLGLLSESHISIHTWPEHGYAAADVFTCSNTCSPGRACDSLADLLQAGRSDVSVVAR